MSDKILTKKSDLLAGFLVVFAFFALCVYNQLNPAETISEHNNCEDHWKAFGYSCRLHYL